MRNKTFRYLVSYKLHRRCGKLWSRAGVFLGSIYSFLFLIVKCGWQEIARRSVWYRGEGCRDGEKAIRVDVADQQLDANWCYWSASMLLCWTDTQHC